MEEADAPAPVRALPDSEVLAALIEPFEDAEWQRSAGQDVVFVRAGRLREFAEAAHLEGFEMCVDVTATDYHRSRRPRFEVVVNLLSHQHNTRLRIRVPVPADDPTVPSLVPVYPGANFFEREVYDMFGIVFEDHPDLTRILMPDDWVGHPLRKDFAVGSVPVQFKESHQVT
jgi:NADH/F420H2 dehydrogenase subunit C